MGFFSGLTERWREARADRLYSEFLDAVQRLSEDEKRVGERAAFFLAGMWRQREQRGLPRNDWENREAARALRKIGRDAFALDRGQATALFILSAHFEAAALPGPRAIAVRFGTEKMIEAALSRYPSPDDDFA